MNKLVTIDGYRVLAQPDPFAGGVLAVAVPLSEANEQLDRLLVVLALVIAVRAARARRSPGGRWCGSGCSRWTAWATPRAASPAATSPTASSEADPRTEVGPARGSR